MKIDSSNSVVGIYIHELKPREAIYTEGDLVYHNGILFKCLAESNSTPDSNEPEWEHYINGLKVARNLNDLMSDTENNFATTNSLRQYLQTQLSGLNFDGSLKILASGDLDSVSSNTTFKVDSTFLNTLKTQDPSKVPFEVDINNTTYLLVTRSDIKAKFGGPAYYQELLGVNPTSNKLTRWYRTGVDLASTPWRPYSLDIESEDVTDYIYSIVDKFQSSNALIDSLFSGVSSGDYKFWKTIETISYSSGKVTFSKSENVGITPYSSNKYYRIYYSYSNSVGKVLRKSFDITPADHKQVLSTGKTLYFNDESLGTSLGKVNSDLTRINMPSGSTITSMIESYKFIV